MASEPTGARRLTLGRLLLTATGVTTAVSPYLADFNATHVYNPEWPPHAKFHNGQTMSMGAALGLATLVTLWRRGEPSRERLDTATAFASLYWLTQASALLYPGVKLLDARDGRPASNRGPQWAIFGGLLAVNGLAHRAERRRLARD